MIYGAVSLAALHEWNEEGKTVPELRKHPDPHFFIFCGFIKQKKKRGKPQRVRKFKKVQAKKTHEIK